MHPFLKICGLFTRGKVDSHTVNRVQLVDEINYLCQHLIVKTLLANMRFGTATSKIKRTHHQDFGQLEPWMFQRIPLNVLEILRNS
jgi:hypothetical protein